MWCNFNEYFMIQIYILLVNIVKLTLFIYWCQCLFYIVLSNVSYFCNLLYIFNMFNYIQYILIKGSKKIRKLEEFIVTVIRHPKGIFKLLKSYNNLIRIAQLLKIRRRRDRLALKIQLFVLWLFWNTVLPFLKVNTLFSVYIYFLLWRNLLYVYQDM